MNKVILIIAISILSIICGAKSVNKVIKLANFKQQGPFIFMTKLHLGVGGGQMDISYTKGDQIDSQEFYEDLAIGLINQTVYKQFSQASSCREKMSFISRKERFQLRQERHGMKHIKIFDLTQEQIWYFYIFSCMENLDVLDNSQQQIKMTFSVLNNGSHFGQNQLTLYAYILMFLIWGALIIKFAIPMANLLSFNNPDGLKIFIFGGLVSLGAAYLYKLIHLVLYNIDGSGIHAFQILYIILKNAGQAIITTMIVSTAWGWSITHLKSNHNYVIIGVLAMIINTTSLILSSLTDQHEELYHCYDTIPGGIILITRILMFLIFFAGIVNILKDAPGKIAFFIRKLALIGGIYLLSWPITVLFVELALPNYLHYQVITFVEETVHICATTLICNMIAHPQSAYRKVSLHEDDNPLRMNDYRKN